MMGVTKLFSMSLVLIMALNVRPGLGSSIQTDTMEDRVDNEEGDFINKRSPQAAAVTIPADTRQSVRALVSANILREVLKRHQGISSPNVPKIQGELDKLIASQKQSGMYDTIEKLRATEDTPEIEKIKVDTFLDDFGGPTKDAGKIAKQIVKIDSVEAQLDKLPFNMGLEYLVATMKRITPLLKKYQLWDPIMKAMDMLKVTTRPG